MSAPTPAALSEAPDLDANALPETGAVCEACAQLRATYPRASDETIRAIHWANRHTHTPAPVPSPSGDPLDGKLGELRKLAEKARDAVSAYELAASRGPVPDALALAVMDTDRAMENALPADTVLSLLSSLSSLRARVGEAEADVIAAFVDHLCAEFGSVIQREKLPSIGKAFLRKRATPSRRPTAGGSE